MGNICTAERILIVPNQYVSKIIHIDQINNIKISFIQGDICEEKLDAIINGTDSLMRNKNSNIVEKAGHEEIAKDFVGDITDSRPLSSGKAFLTTAGNLNAKHLIHLSIPVWAGGDHNELGLLDSCYKDAFNIIKENKIKVVGLTDVSSGIFGIPAKLGRNALIKALIECLHSQRDQKYIDEIKIIHYEFSTIKKFAEDFQKAKQEYLENFPVEEIEKKIEQN